MISCTKLVAYIASLFPGCNVTYRERQDDYFRRREIFVEQRGEDRLSFQTAAGAIGCMFAAGCVVGDVKLYRVEMSHSFGDNEIRLVFRYEEPKP